MDEELYDVVVVGYGPVGQVMSALLGRYGHRVAVFERWPRMYAYPRAGHFDHEGMRIFQRAGAAETVEQQTVNLPAYRILGADGDELISIDWDAPNPSGWRSDYVVYQPELEAALDAAVRRRPTVEVHQGWEAVALTQEPDHVTVTFSEGAPDEGGNWRTTGATRTVRARYVIGADGANSFIRRSGAFGWSDLGFPPSDWLAITVSPTDPDAEIDMPDAAQLCEPGRPASLFRWLGRHSCRFEFMLLPGEEPARMASAESCWQLLGRWGLTPDNAALVRNAVYTFRGMLADTFRDGRLLLVGDAAHLMPPFMGQGMCSGFRDAMNLAWKLDLVLRDAASTRLLDSYTGERRPHDRTLIELSMALGSVICVTDPEAAVGRDAAFRTGQAPPLPAFPSLTGGLLLRGGDGTPAPSAGQLGVQGRVVYQEQTGRFDDLIGGGWMVLSRKPDVTTLLSAEQRRFLDRIGARVIHVSRARMRTPDSVIDLDGDYLQWFNELSAQVVLVRPDFYVFGAGAASDLPDLVDTLADQMPAPALV
jgi:2-polyprenyl-6-methoxyphenol hydroxylase-like FAD-dependent oxidoreductase